jgi:probable DNA metabolism protein
VYINYLYDGTLPGLLSTIYDCLALGFVPQQITPQNRFQPDLFSSTKQIETSQLKASKVLNRLRSISHRLAGTALYIYAAKEDDFEISLLKYLKLGLRYGNKVEQMLADPAVEKIVKIVNRVMLETHRLKGLARFRELQNGMYYAPLEPDNNVVPLMGKHFQERMADQEWLIHDTKRNIAVLYDKQKTKIIDFNTTEDINRLFSAKEKKYQELWREFHRSIAIEARNNPKLQKQLMPKRYWKYLIELPQNS